MTLGASILLLSIGAILKFAVTATVSGIDLPTIGLVLMGAGAIGLVLGVMLMTRRNRTDVTHTDSAGTVRRSSTIGNRIDPPL